MTEQTLHFETPVYDPEATIVINELPDVYFEKRLSMQTARDIGGKLRNEERYRLSSESLSAKIKFAEQYLKDNYDELELHADELAEILGITLTNEVEFEMSVTISGSITLPMGKSFDDLSEWDFDISLSCNDSDYEVNDYDATIDRMYES